VFEDDEVYNKTGKDGKPKMLQELKQPYMFLKPKKGCANAMSTFYWPNKKTAQTYEVSEELHGRLKYLLEQMK